MKGDLEYAGHTHKEERRTPAVSGLGVIAITGLLITVTVAGTIFGVHLMNKIDNQSSRINSLEVCLERKSFCVRW